MRTLNFPKGCEIIASENEDDYPVMPTLPSYCIARDGLAASKEALYRSVFYGENVENVVFTGEGLINGEGANWWTRNSENLKFERPRLFQCLYCKNFKIEKLTWKDSPFWTIHFVYSENIEISDLAIFAEHKR